MVGFFSLLIGYFVLLIISYYKANKIGIRNQFYREDRKEYAIKNNKSVWFEKMNGDERIYLEVNTNRRVYKGTDKYGLRRWYYEKTEKPMQYIEDKRVMQSLIRNKTIALAKNRKWCVAENFWDDSIIRLENDILLANTYLDDFVNRDNPFEIIEWNNYAREWNKINFDKISKRIFRNNSSLFSYSNSTPEQKEKAKEYFYNNNPFNQKVYLKNMRPYQLHLIAEPKTDKYDSPIKTKQYLIRFGEKNYFNFKTQHCISDKQVSDYWGKWYALTEKEYLDLTLTDEGTGICYHKIELNTMSSLKSYLKPIDIKDIAFVKGVKEFEWRLKNCGIIKAFDDEGNFIEDLK